MKVKKYVLVAIGSVALALGTVGAFIPILPTFPFYLLTLICYSKSSDKLSAWFRSTKLYKNTFDAHFKGGGMTLRTRIEIIISVTLVMGFGFIMMKGLTIARIILAIVWALHVFYFAVLAKKKAPEVENNQINSTEENYVL